MALVFQSASQESARQPSETPTAGNCHSQVAPNIVNLIVERPPAGASAPDVLSSQCEHRMYRCDHLSSTPARDPNQLCWKRIAVSTADESTRLTRLAIVPIHVPIAVFSCACPGCSLAVAGYDGSRSRPPSLTRLPLDFRTSEFGVRVDRRVLTVISRSSLLFATCEKIAVILADAPTPYSHVSIELGTLDCSHCGQRLTARALDANLALVRRMTVAATAVDPENASHRLVDYRPPQPDEPRRLVRHFQNLAKHVDDWFSDDSGSCASDRSEDHLLWDRTIDG